LQTMIYIKDDPNHCNPETDDLGPMAGTRIGHEVVSGRVIEIKIQHAKQSFRSARRELLMLDALGHSEVERGSDLHKELMDRAHETAGRRPLVSP
jgi:hypothetical protein